MTVGGLVVKMMAEALPLDWEVLEDLFLELIVNKECQSMETYCC